MWATKTEHSAQMLARLAVRGGPLGSDTWYVVGMLTLNFYLPLLITIMFSHDGTLTERHTRTATHTLAQTQDKLQGWVDSCGVRGNATHTHTHLEKCLLCCQVVGCQKEREEKGNWKSAVTHRRCMAAGFSTYYNGRSTLGPFALVVPKFNDSPFM